MRWGRGGSKSHSSLNNKSERALTSSTLCKVLGWILPKCGIMAALLRVSVAAKVVWQASRNLAGGSSSPPIICHHLAPPSFFFTISSPSFLSFPPRVATETLGAANAILVTASIIIDVGGKTFGTESDGEDKRAISDSSSSLSLVSLVKSFAVSVTLLGPEKLVTISECHNNDDLTEKRLPFSTSMVDKKLSQCAVCHNIRCHNNREGLSGPTLSLRSSSLDLAL